MTMLACFFALALAAPAADYPPPPEPTASSGMLVGAFTCPLWNAEHWQEISDTSPWEVLAEYPLRTPALGYYDEGAPEVTDWEVKWALEHGIDFFVPCWYRAAGNEGKPLEQVLSHWLHEGLFESRYGEQLDFAIMWENGNKVSAGIADEADLLENLLPYWLEHYFSRDNYMKLDGKPVLFIYRPEILSKELGGPEQTRAALEKMRQACKEAGFEGLLIFGEHHLRLKEDAAQYGVLGFDYAFSYHWPTFTELMPKDPTPAEIIAAQEACWERFAEVSDVPTAPTVSMGWNSAPWGSPFSRAQWRLAPADFQELCERAEKRLESTPADALPPMVLIDNWNEFAEGHYIAPHQEHGFGYLDAIRRAFTQAPEEHVDLLPQDLGLGPYDALHRQYSQAGED